MNKFHAIEGLRGWLAWIVVFAHLAYASGIYTHGIGQKLGSAGYSAVVVFMIVSGFVIAHLVTQRAESYAVYLLRRFMRIFPLFVVTCILGYYATDLDAATLAKVSYANDPGFAFRSYVAGIADSDHRFLGLHALLHLSMLHGMIADSLLPFSQVAFNGPAWSLSLEWQFYLVAPLAILFAQRRQGLLPAALLLCAGEAAARWGWFGVFPQPSLLPAAAGYFAVGVATRLAYPAIVRAAWDPPVLLFLGIALLPLTGDESKPLFMWMVFVFALERSRSERFRAKALGLAPSQPRGATAFTRHFRLALESRPARFIGERSYSTYLCHMPIIALCHRLWLLTSPVAKSTPTFLALTAMTVPLTILLSELLYRGVERPGIALGAMMARAMESRSAGRLAKPAAAGGTEA
jgi:peptidoglycan/LPS O-acetylase OafA/YrhL